MCTESRRQRQTCTEQDALPFECGFEDPRNPTRSRSTESPWGLSAPPVRSAFRGLGEENVGSLTQGLIRIATLFAIAGIATCFLGILDKRACDSRGGVNDGK